MLNRQRELTLPRPTAAPTATGSAYFNTAVFVMPQASGFPSGYSYSVVLSLKLRVGGLIARMLFNNTGVRGIKHNTMHVLRTFYAQYNACIICISIISRPRLINTRNGELLTKKRGPPLFEST